MAIDTTGGEYNGPGNTVHLRDGGCFKRGSSWGEDSKTDAEDLAFKDGSFDRVVVTCVFCSVPDPVRGLREIKRVLRPGGEAILLEHMRPGGFLGKVFDALDPLMSRLMGPHINRRTLENVQKAGLQIVEERNVFSDWVKVIVAH